jgi:DNA-binding PucR family transcriptional regulator
MSQLRELALNDRRLLRGKLDSLMAQDRHKGTSYVATLRAYLDAFGDLPKASEAMFVHPNTFRYRLKRLIELAALDLDDPEERIVLHLQLHLMSSESK